MFQYFQVVFFFKIQHTRTLGRHSTHAHSVGVAAQRREIFLAQGCYYRAAPMASATNVAPAAASAAARLSDAETSAWERLLESGFPRDASLCALACCEWRLDSALDWLLMREQYRAAVLPPPAAAAPGEPSPESEPPGVPLSNAPAASQVQADVPRASSSRGKGHVAPRGTAAPLVPQRRARIRPIVSGATPSGRGSAAASPRQPPVAALRPLRGIDSCLLTSPPANRPSLCVGKVTR